MVLDKYYANEPERSIKTLFILQVSIASMDDDEVMNSNNRNPLESTKDSLGYIANSMKSSNVSTCYTDL